MWFHNHCFKTRDERRGGAGRKSQEWKGGWDLVSTGAGGTERGIGILLGFDRKFKQKHEEEMISDY